jgi:hypothetical protein
MENEQPKNDSENTSADNSESKSEKQPIKENTEGKVTEENPSEPTKELHFFKQEKAPEIKQEEAFKAQPTVIRDDCQIYIIPSWSKLNGFHNKGYYVSSNQQVKNITSDPVIFYARKSMKVHKPYGYVYVLWGLGLIHLKFELQSGRLITDFRQINAIVLQDFAYDFLASQRKIALENDHDIILNELVSKIPYDLSWKGESQRAFLNGAILRNAFTQHKEIMLDMLEKLQKSIKDEYNPVNSGFLLLTLTEQEYNNILTNSFLNEKEYFNPTAVISEIKPSANEFLTEILSKEEKEEALAAIVHLHDAMRKFQYNKADLMSILDGLNAELKIKFSPKGVYGPVHKLTGLKKQLLFTADLESVDKVTPCNAKFERKLNWPESAEKSEIHEEKPIVAPLNYDKFSEKIYQPVALDQMNVKVDGYTSTAKEVDSIKPQFELRATQNPTVEERSLPEFPVSEDADKSPEKIIKVLEYVLNLVNENYSMKAIGEACELAWAKLRKILFQSEIIYELNSFTNQFIKQPKGLGLNAKDKAKIIERLTKWINEQKEIIRKEQERLEQIRLEEERKAREEAERKERERLERERKEREEAERKERERLERERKEREEAERKERERLERERKEREEAERREKERIEKEKREREEAERLEKERKEQERIREEQEMARKLEEQRLELQKEEEHRRKLREMEEQMAREREEAEKRRKIEEEQARIAAQQRELERLKQEQATLKQRMKEEKEKKKQEEKRQKEIEKERKKLEKEQEKLKKLKK